jgi:AGCS family alanine or glycine:cation symporter
MVQANSIAALMRDTFHISPWITGAVLTICTALVMIHGIRSISRVCGFLVPFMAIFYILGCGILLVMDPGGIPSAIALIFRSAFTGQAAFGGFIGAGMRDAVRFGIARGLFSNESGMGSAPIVAAAARTQNPVRQALVSSTGTFWDTVVVCALTGIVLVNSGVWTRGLQGVALTEAAFARIPHVGPVVLTVGLFTFVASTIFGWCYYGEKAFEYLFGARATEPYRKAWVGAVMLGSVMSLPSVWAFADIANALMAIPNLISLVLLSGVVVAETRTHLWNAPDA